MGFGVVLFFYVDRETSLGFKQGNWLELRSASPGLCPQGKGGPEEKEIK